ncbi:MAG: hypothetical protein M3410_18960 [Acidobacteriota bacterium]|nr:hypothetical protein [Acidobacteriota bacterium]
MTNNQKIAIGCGSAGCLGLLVVAVAAVGLYFFYERLPPMSNRNSNFNINTNTDHASNSNSSTDSSDEESSSSMSDDDKHKLFHAAGAANDIALFSKVMTRLGLFESDGSPSDDYSGFVRNHVGWLLKNSDFARTVDTPEKARAYVDAHLDD